MNKILGIFNGNDPVIDIIGRLTDKAGVEFAPLCSPIDKNSLLNAAKSADCVLLGKAGYTASMRDFLAEQLNLHTSLRSFFGSNIVTPALSSMYGKRSGYACDERFGRAAFDTEYISELEIERTARVAYELAEQLRLGVTLVDRASKLLTSALWRKIVSDINEDYPSVPLTMLELGELRRHDPDQKPVYLCSKPDGDILWSYWQNDGYECLLGDSALALYAPTNSSADLIFALPHMLKHCFSLEKEAQDLSDALSCLPPHPNAEDLTAALRRNMRD